MVKYLEIGRLSWIIWPKKPIVSILVRERPRNLTHGVEKARKKMEQKMERDLKMLTMEVRRDVATSQGVQAAT